MKTLTVVLIAALLSGCETDSEGTRYTGEPELVALAKTETVYLCAAFALKADKALRFSWGWCSCSDTSTYVMIITDAKGQPWLREHMRHELLHCLSNATGVKIDFGAGSREHPEYINGVRVKGVVPSWGKK